MIHCDQRDGIAILRLEHGKVNAFDLELAEAISRTLAEVAAGPARAAVLTGTGRIFSAGVDLVRLVEGGHSYVDRFVPALIAAFRDLLVFPLPLVAAVNGHAIAGGCIAAAACDHRVMADGAGRIGIPELLVGVPFPTVALEIMRLAVPPPHLQALVYTGRTCLPSEAIQRGLVDRLVPADRLIDEACRTAADLGSVDPEVFRMTKRALRADAMASIDSAAPADDAATRERWAAPETLAAIRRYLARTLGKRSVRTGE
jgi:enoyl-CoA hydratase